MTDSIYAKAYTEVLAILNCLKQEEYQKIPKEEIEFLQNNCDTGYHFALQKDKELKEQPISKEANAVLVILFEKYFTNEMQKRKLKEILIQNYEKEESKKRMVYSNDIFGKKTNQEKIERDEGVKQEIEVETKTKLKLKNEIDVDGENEIVEYKENLFSKLFYKMKRLCKAIWKK